MKTLISRALAGLGFAAVGAALSFSGVASIQAAGSDDYCTSNVVPAQSQCPDTRNHNVTYNHATAQGSYSVCERVEVVSTGELKSRQCGTPLADSGYLSNVYRKNIVGNNSTSSHTVIGTYDFN